MTALSWHSPRRLILHSMPWSASSFWNRSHVYWLPWSLWCRSSVIGPTAPDRHDQRIRYEVCRHTRLHRPADDPSREQVRHFSDVQPTFKANIIKSATPFCPETVTINSRPHCPVNQPACVSTPASLCPRVDSVALNRHHVSMVQESSHMAAVSSELPARGPSPEDPPDAADAVSRTAVREATADIPDQFFVIQCPVAGRP